VSDARECQVSTQPEREQRKLVMIPVFLQADIGYRQLVASMEANDLLKNLVVPVDLAGEDNSGQIYEVVAGSAGGGSAVRVVLRKASH
jgi:hypothetical protein